MPQIKVDGDRITYRTDRVTAGAIVGAVGYDKHHVRLADLKGNTFSPETVIDISQTDSFTVLELTGATAA